MLRRRGDFKAASTSSGYSFLTFIQNEASDAVFSKFIFNLSSVASFNNLSCRVIVKFKLSFDERNGFWIHEFPMRGSSFEGKYNSKQSNKFVRCSLITFLRYAISRSPTSLINVVQLWNIS